MFHFRVGPWTALPGVADEDEWDDVGGPYLPNSLEWNPTYWDAVRQQVWHAYGAYAYAEIVAVDTWYLKHCAWHDVACAWPDDQIAIGNTLTREQDRLIRKSVEELGCFGNVIWTTGNEEQQASGMNPNWVNAYIATIRDEEKKSGCNFVHMIGTGVDYGGIPADYSITHTTNQISGPCNGRLCVDNEHNPEASPEEEASKFRSARSAGQVWAAWRAGATDEKWEKRLDLFQDVVAGGDAGTGCFAPDPNDSKWIEPPIDPSQRAPQMMAAINEAKAKVGNRCGATAPCTSEPCAPPVHLGCLETNGLVAAELRKMGHCASGPWVDATAVLAPDGKWEEYHVCSTGDGCWTGHPYKFAWGYNGPNPTPPTTPPQEECHNPDPVPVDHWNVKEHIKGANKTIVDSTPLVHNGNYCAAIGFTDGRLDCPVRMEGDPMRLTCETEVVGVPQWIFTGIGGQVSPENPYQYWVPRGNTGTAKVCTQVEPRVCGEVKVTP